MVAHSKNVRERRADLLMIDEAGLLMAPLVRKSWSKRGSPPCLFQRARHREKVSVIGALWLSPVEKRLKLSYGTIAGGYYDGGRVATFVESLVAQTSRPVVIVWDGGNMHKGPAIRSMLSRVGERLWLERLPPYAPMLNPVEGVWSWLKYSRLNNYAPANATELDRRIRIELDVATKDFELLRGFWKKSELPDPLTLLT